MGSRRVVIAADAIQTARGRLGDAVFVEDGIVQAIGTRSELSSRAAVISYPGAVIIPGLRDAHFHPVSYASLLQSTSLKTASDFAELGGRLRAAAAHLPAGEPLVAVRLDDQGLVERRLPDRHDLDTIISDRPVVLHRYCGHVAVANTAALAASGVTGATPSPAGGIIDRDPTGIPTGVLRETAIELVTTQLHRSSTIDAAGLLDATRRLAGLGITSLGGMAGCGDGPWATLGDETAVLADAAPELPIRIHAMVIANSDDQLREKARVLGEAGGLLRWLGLKRFADGSFGGHTAAMHEAFTDRQGESGTLRLNEHDASLARTAIELGGSVAIHAIGDLACTKVIDLFTELRPMVSDGAKLRLEHASVLTASDVTRLADLGAIASVQPAFIGSETEWLEARVGDRVHRTYGFRTMEAAGVTLAGGSDCPVEHPNPLLGMALARDRAGLVPDEGLTAERALAMFTDGAAKSLGEPVPLAIGSPADLTVVDRDPISATPDEVRTTHVIATYVNGVAVDIDQSSPVWPG